MTPSQHLLLKLMEECAEVAQRASKMMQFGGDEAQEGHSNNSYRLREEVNHLLVVLELLQEKGLLLPVTPQEMNDVRILKRGHIQKYLELSIERGQVIDEMYWK